MSFPCRESKQNSSAIRPDIVKTLTTLIRLQPLNQFPTSFHSIQCLFISEPNQRLDGKLQEQHNVQTQITKGKKQDTKRIEEYSNNLLGYLIRMN